MKNKKFLTFMRKNALYLILSACILAMGLSVTLMLVEQNKKDNIKLENPPIVENPLPDDKEDDNEQTITPDQPNDQPVQKPVTFIMPVLSPTSIAEYSDTIVWCSTLNRFEAHKAMDFFAEEGTDVLAVYDGTVEKIENNFLKGISVTINHGNGLKTVYNSLADSDQVFIGQTVTQGEKIGEVSVSNRQEYKDGAHLHFEVFENDVNIDPIKYLEFDEK